MGKGPENRYRIFIVCPGGGGGGGGGGTIRSGRPLRFLHKKGSSVKWTEGSTKKRRDKPKAHGRLQLVCQPRWHQKAKGQIHNSSLLSKT